MCHLPADDTGCGAVPCVAEGGGRGYPIASMSFSTRSSASGLNLYEPTLFFYTHSPEDPLDSDDDGLGDGQDFSEDG